MGKKYRIGANRERYLSLRDEMVRKAQGFSRQFIARHRHVPRAEEFWALRDVSFAVHEGEAIGIVGRNGAGKSTLLKILSQITPPTEGKITMRGRVASLLEVGTGFHPELTGRENIFLNGTILGMTRAEIRRKFDEIVAFSEIEKFLDTPVKRYSSGMYVRLAFAVAAHLEPEILVVDEVLAVGDAEFQRKCLGKMGEVTKQGRTVLFVSHNMAAVGALCEGGIVLEQGHVTFRGPTEDTIKFYVNGKRGPVTPDMDTSIHPARVANRTPIIQRVAVCGGDGVPRSSFAVGETMMFKIALEAPNRLSGVILGLHVYNDTAQRVVTFHTREQMTGVVNIIERTTMACVWDVCNLMPGDYNLVIGLACNSGEEDRIEPVLTFTVTEADFYRSGRMPSRTDGYFLPECRWRMGKDW